MNIKVGDTVELKKMHPCGSKIWKITRVGMDIKLRCFGCSHEIISPRHKIEKSIKCVISEGENNA